jgi:starvation-inducible DNA-binding protein
MVALLQRQLTDAIDPGLQTKQPHWNIKGPNFIALHELFDRVNKEIGETTDEVAERAVAPGGIVNGTAQAVARETRLEAYPATELSGAKHVIALRAALANYSVPTRKVIAAAADAGDANTADVPTEVSRTVDQPLWMAEAHAVGTN